MMNSTITKDPYPQRRFEGELVVGRGFIVQEQVAVQAPLKHTLKVHYTLWMPDIS